MLGKLGEVAYKLQLPPSSKVHPVFHVLQLKKAIGEYTTEAILPADLEEEHADIVEPEKVLANRIIMKNSFQVNQFLLQWKVMPMESATWEDEPNLRSQFPHFSLEDKTVLSGVGSDRVLNQDVGLDHDVGLDSKSKGWKVYVRKKKAIRNGEE